MAPSPYFFAKPCKHSHNNRTNRCCTPTHVFTNTKRTNAHTNEETQKRTVAKADRGGESDEPDNVYVCVCVSMTAPELRTECECPGLQESSIFGIAGRRGRSVRDFRGLGQLGRCN